VSEGLNKIEAQPTLPWRVVTSVVMQGLRIRMGRALVTIGGVALGTAFLMATVTDRIVTSAVSVERAARAETRRMVATLAADTGPLENRVVAVIADRPLKENENRFVAQLKESGASEVRVAVGTGREGITKGVSAVVAVGGPVITKEELAVARQPVVGVFEATARAPEGAVVVNLTRPVPEEEAAALAEQERQESVRLIWVLSVALAVTVIGVSNAMLMSVTERFREIGTMKCLGALSAFIRRVFLVEALIVGATGAAAGMLLGLMLPVLRYAAIDYGWAMVFSAVPWGQLALGGVASWLAGTALALLAAVYPARAAARMVPAAALRSTI